MRNQLPPHDQEAERSVIGSLLRDGALADDVAPILRAEQFYLDSSQKIYAAILELRDKGTPIDIVTLADRLRSKHQIDDVGGYDYIAGLLDAAPTTANVEYYAGIVKDHWVRRSLIHAGNDLVRSAHEGYGDVSALVEKVEGEVFKIANYGAAGGASHASSIVEAVYDRIDRRARARNGGVAEYVPTGLIDVDHILGGGLNGGELIIVAARPSIGKTSCAMSIVRNATRLNLGVFVVSLEQTKEELMERMLATIAGVNHQKLRRGLLNEQEYGKLLSAGESISRSGLFIDDAPRQTMARIASNARRLKLRKNISLVVIDYLQLVEPADSKIPRHEQVAAISRRQKQLANELGIPVLALAQLSRNVEYRAENIPRLADLKESGAIESDADVVMLLHRPPDRPPNVLDIIVAKQRNGPTGEASVLFDRASGRFSNLAPGG